MPLALKASGIPFSKARSSAKAPIPAKQYNKLVNMKKPPNIHDPYLVIDRLSGRRKCELNCWSFRRLPWTAPDESMAANLSSLQQEILNSLKNLRCVQNTDQSLRVP